jgi:NAD(P)-dependent dehydrogenase (short-subunit alcohol dehydrogenase family)
MKKFVLITGTSSGLGKATAQRLAEEGFVVFAGVRKEQDSIELQSIHSNIKPIYLDVTNDDSVKKAFEVISQETDCLYGLVNNAGIATGGPIEYIPIEMLEKQFAINVFGAIRVAQNFLPLLNKSQNGARIVNISSMSSYGVFPFVSPYCASKRALDMFFNSLLIENKNPLLRIVSIKPGVVCTPIWNKSVDAVEQSFANVSQEARLKYEKELLFLAENARKNEKKGLQPQCVADAVYKALTHKNPKLSYNVGKDSCFARLMSFLPQGFCNALIKKGLKCKMAISERK